MKLLCGDEGVYRCGGEDVIGVEVRVCIGVEVG